MRQLAFLLVIAALVAGLLLLTDAAGRLVVYWLAYG